MASEFRCGDRRRLGTLLRQGRHGATRGQALVEFVFVLPLLLILMIGIIQCGILLNNWVILTDAVRSGAREISISRGPPPHADACAKSNNRIIAASIGLTTASINLVPVVFESPSTCTNMAGGKDATVSATYPCNLSILGIDYAPGCTLRAATTMRIE